MKTLGSLFGTGLALGLVLSFDIQNIVACIFLGFGFSGLGFLLGSIADGS